MKKIIQTLILSLFISISIFSENMDTVRCSINGLVNNVDPQVCTDVTSVDLINYIFEGLTKTDSKGNVIPAVAESWSQKGKIWTFNLRKNAKWSNGEPVVAKDFIAAWERVLNPTTQSEFAYLMYCIEGAEQYNRGTSKDFSTVGVKALDDRRIQVTLNKPMGYFYKLLSLATFFPQNRKYFNLNKYTYGYNNGDGIVGNGPFTIKEWNGEENIIFTKSKYYWNRDKIQIKNIEFDFYLDSVLDSFEKNLVDIISVKTYEHESVKNKSGYKTYDNSSWYLQLNNTKNIFSNAKIRRAISMAIDREKLENAGLLRKSEAIVPNGISGVNDFFRSEYDEKEYGVIYNVDLAKQLFDEGLKELGINLKKIPLLTLIVGNAEYAINIGEFIKSELKNTFGLKVKLEPLDFDERIQRQRNLDYDISLAGWGPDYNDPMTYLEIWTSYSLLNTTGWSNSEYDVLINSAKYELDEKKRMSILNQAEKLLIKEAAVIPIYVQVRAVLVKDNIKGLTLGMLSPTINLINAWVDNK